MNRQLESAKLTVLSILSWICRLFGPASEHTSIGKNTVSSDALTRATKPSASMALATAAGWGRGLFTLVRITVMAFR
ncbi:ABC transporter ATP-binding protein, partial [Rhizobium phaseoli]